jgi:hypothetical protein
MGKIGSAGAIVSAVLLIAQPAAAHTAYAAQFERGASAYAGLSFRLPLGTEARSKPLVRLQMRLDAAQRRPALERLPDLRPRGLELGLLETGKPALFVDGRSMADAPTRARLGGSAGQTALVVGGVLLAVVVIAVAAGGGGMGDTCPTVGGSRDHCIDP